MKTIIKIIFLAAVSVALAIIAEQIVAAAASNFWHKEVIQESYSRFTWFLVFSALAEEISKFWGVYFVIRRNFGLDKIRFIFASLLFGFLWGAVEIGLILFTDQAALLELRAGNSRLIFSLASIISLHSITAFLMGVLISADVFLGRLKPVKTLFFPSLLHLLFNFLIIQRGNFTDFLVVISLGIVFFIGIATLFLNLRKLA